jgi:hypothetical protein
MANAVPFMLPSAWTAASRTTGSSPAVESPRVGSSVKELAVKRSTGPRRRRRRSACIVRASLMARGPLMDLRRVAGVVRALALAVRAREVATGALPELRGAVRKPDTGVFAAVLDAAILDAAVFEGAALALCDAAVLDAAVLDAVALCDAAVLDAADARVRERMGVGWESAKQWSGTLSIASARQTAMRVFQGNFKAIRLLLRS